MRQQTRQFSLFILFWFDSCADFWNKNHFPRCIFSPQIMVEIRSWCRPQVCHIGFYDSPMCSENNSSPLFFLLLLSPSSLRADESRYPGAGQFHRLHVGRQPSDACRRHAHPTPLHPALACWDSSLRLPADQSPARSRRLHLDGPPACLPERGHPSGGVGVQLAEVHPLLWLRFW